MSIIDEMRKNIINIDSEITDSQNELKTYEDKLKNIYTINQQIAELTGKQSILTNEITNNQKKLESLRTINNEILQLNEKQKTLTYESTNNQNKLKSLRGELEKIKPMYNQILQLTDKQKMLVNRKSNLLTEIGKMQEKRIQKSTVSFMNNYNIINTNT